MPDKIAELRRELSIANHILANEDVVDAFGHISVRHPEDSDRYLISRHRAAELVEPSDILELTLDSVPVKPTDARLYSELVIHGEVYKARPDVYSVCHHHAPSVMPFCITGAALVPVMPLGAVMGPKVPVWDSRDEFGDTTHCACMIAKHHLQSIARHGLTAERPSEDGGYERPFGRGGQRNVGFSYLACYSDDDFAVLNCGNGDSAIGREALS